MSSLLHTCRYKKLYKHPLVATYLRLVGSGTSFTRDCIGWGYKPSGLSAKKNAKRKKAPLLLFEDSPVRSLQPDYHGSIYGITVDHSGAMFDASGDSDLIKALQQEIHVDEQTPGLMERYVASGVSKYNWSLNQDSSEYETGILLVDQKKEDSALQYSGLRADDFSRMFEDALSDHPDAIIYIKTHPDHKYRAKESCFTKEQLAHSRVRILPPELSPADCFRSSAPSRVCGHLAHGHGGAAARV